MYFQHTLLDRDIEDQNQCNSSSEKVVQSHFFHHLHYRLRPLPLHLDQRSQVLLMEEGDSAQKLEQLGIQRGLESGTLTLPYDRIVHMRSLERAM